MHSDQTKVLFQRDFRLKVLTKYCINYGFLNPKSYKINDVYCTLLQQDALGLEHSQQIQLELVLRTDNLLGGS